MKIASTGLLPVLYRSSTFICLSVTQEKYNNNNNNVTSKNLDVIDLRKISNCQDCIEIRRDKFNVK